MKKTLKTLLAAATATAALTGLVAPAANAQQQFIAEMRYIPFSFCPRSWTRSDGQLLPIASNQALFSLIGTTYGGDGRTTMAVPHMRGRVAVGEGTGAGMTPRRQGQLYGSETVTLTIAEMPSHTHSIRASSGAPNTATFNGAGWAEFPPASPIDTYNTGGTLNEQARSDTIGNTGGNQSHFNMAPTSAMPMCIALQGLFPSRN